MLVLISLAPGILSEEGGPKLVVTPPETNDFAFAERPSIAPVVGTKASGLTGFCPPPAVVFFCLRT